MALWTATIRAVAQGVIGVAFIQAIVIGLTLLSADVPWASALAALMLGRGVDAPMPVILLGALGGMGTGGILGMLVGAVVLALGYQIFMHWVENNQYASTSHKKTGHYSRLVYCCFPKTQR